jgi:hypothetical protein
LHRLQIFFTILKFNGVAGIKVTPQMLKTLETLMQFYNIIHDPQFLNHTLENLLLEVWNLDRLYGLVVRVSGYKFRYPGFDSPTYHIF